MLKGFGPRVRPYEVSVVYDSRHVADYCLHVPLHGVLPVFVCGTDRVLKVVILVLFDCATGGESGEEIRSDYLRP